MLDYDRTCEGFRWSTFSDELDRLPGGRGLNIGMRLWTVTQLESVPSGWHCGGSAKVATVAISPWKS